MELVTDIIIAVGLAMDAFAVSLGVGTSGRARDGRSVFRLAFHFGFFQGGMTLLGWLLGSTVVDLIANFDHWLAFVLLAWVGLRMVKEGFARDGEESAFAADPSRGRVLMVLCVATSIDALAVGLSMAMLDTNVIFASVVIAVITSALSLVGLLGGNRLGSHFGKRMEVLGGLLLVGIGVRILVSHLLA
ncbi:predicted membrane protein [Longilinea arvoryzae]|uniref:Putative manganese efflux pump MntP n=1 Tax=Longilinea arvoryzae TaxID=360412 RepID=A0A0S7BCQ0_9CHLR|nr:manganese efflux pump MntP family protein [Longilinea arvoryzae]GAP13001.1 predicted membrane protein [Longilinea arvoryzae]